MKRRREREIMISLIVFIIGFFLTIYICGTVNINVDDSHLVVVEPAATVEAVG